MTVKVKNITAVAISFTALIAVVSILYFQGNTTQIQFTTIKDEKTSNWLGLATIQGNTTQIQFTTIKDDFGLATVQGNTTQIQFTTIKDDSGLATVQGNTTQIKDENTSNWLRLTTIQNSTPTMYVVILEYEGQQGNGLASLRDFQCILPSIYNNSYILEPQIKDSHMRTFIQGSLHFSSFFNLDHFNTQSRKVGYSEIVKDERFVKFSARRVIFIIARCGSKERVIWKAQDHHNSCLGSKEIQPLLNIHSLKIYHKILLNERHMKQKCIVRVIELNGLDVRLLKVKWSDHESVKHKQRLHNFIFDKWSPHEVTLVVDFWSMAIRVPGMLCNRTNFHRLIPSTKLISTARKYEEKFMKGESKVAIMLRVEKLLMLARERKYNDTLRNNFIKECFQKTLSLLGKATGNRTGIIPLVTLDIGGQYGTDTIHRVPSEDAIIMAKDLLTSLYSGRWTISEWEKSFTQVTDGVTDRGYIAALQRVLASRADCLITTGGGTFQMLARNDFMYYHNSSSKCVFRVCDKYYHR